MVPHGYKGEPRLGYKNRDACSFLRETSNAQLAACNRKNPSENLNLPMNLSALTSGATPGSTSDFVNGTSRYNAFGNREIGDPGGGGAVTSLKRTIESVETGPSVNEQGVVAHTVNPVPYFRFVSPTCFPLSTTLNLFV